MGDPDAIFVKDVHYEHLEEYVTITCVIKSGDYESSIIFIQGDTANRFIKYFDASVYYRDFYDGNVYQFSSQDAMIDQLFYSNTNDQLDLITNELRDFLL